MWGAWRWWRRARKKEKGTGHDSKLFLRALVMAAPLGFIAIEAGWVVTEVGRQPWIIYGVMRTGEAVTPMPGLVVPFVTFTILYVFLSIITAWLLLLFAREAAARAQVGGDDAGGIVAVEGDFCRLG